MMKMNAFDEWVYALAKERMEAIELTGLGIGLEKKD